MKCNMLIKGGRIIDPARNVDYIGDVMIQDGRMVSHTSGESVQADYTVDAQGCLVLPGLIDFHAHLYYQGLNVGVVPDFGLLPNGVTTAVDAGTAGASNYQAFSQDVIAKSHVRIKSYLNVSSAGLTLRLSDENTDPKYFSFENISWLFQQYKGELLGLKVRLSKGMIGEPGVEPLKATIKMAEQLGCPIVAHISDPPVELSEMISLLRKGDVFVHAYQAVGHTIFDEDGNIFPAIREARERGVIFDIGAGRHHFSFKNARAAIRNNFLPDVITTDISRMSLYYKPVFSLPYVMSMYLNLGIPLNYVLGACTATPAKLMNLSNEVGTLAAGACADVCIMRLAQEQMEFIDPFGDKFVGESLLIPQMTIRAGQIVYRQINF